MTKIHNFSAGPAILPQDAINAGIEALKNFEGTGLSLIEVSHRGKEFVQVMEEARALAKQLLGVGDDYEALFLQGGASTQFLMLAYNLLERKAAYLETGTWSKNAIKEARLFGQVDVVGSSSDKNFSYIPKGYTIPSDADYFHITSNNTIFGTQVQEFPESPVPLVCDMSSDIFSKPIDGSKFDLIYAGAQKNMGPAGTTLIVLKKALLGRVSRAIPSMMNYQIHIDKGSMYNTPSVFAVYVTLHTLKWIDKIGLENMKIRNEEKAAILYQEIDNNELFSGVASLADRSRMNVTFILNDDTMNPKFLEACNEAKINGIKGHRSVGGFRASMYNALDLDSVQALVNVMQTFKI